MRPHLSYRDRLYLAFLAADVLALIASLRYWWKAAT